MNQILEDEKADTYNFVKFLTGFFKKNKTSWGKNELVLKIDELALWWFRKGNKK